MKLLLLVLLLLAVVCCTAHPGNFGCHRVGLIDWKQSGHYCFKYFSVKLNYLNAQIYCANVKRGTQLASIHSAAQNQMILELIGYKGTKKVRTWIGGKRSGYRKPFRWNDGTPWNYSNWKRGEPNLMFRNEDCLEMNYKNAGKWNDVRCYQKKPFVCQYRLH